MHRPGVAAVVAAALLVAACSDDTDSGARTGDERFALTTTSTSSTTTTTAAPLVGEPVVVLEQGFSLFPDPVDLDNDLGGFGAVIENPNGHAVASGVTVTMRLLGVFGEELARDTSLLNGIMPGQRMAVGRTLIEPIEAPASLEVTVDVATFLEPAADGALEAVDIQTLPLDGGGMQTTFRVASTWPAEEEGVDVAALYRAEDGRILAAERTTMARVPSGGEAEGAIRLLAPIPELAVTEVHVGRGFAAQSVG